MIQSQPYVHPKEERLREITEWSVKSVPTPKDINTPTFQRKERLTAVKGVLVIGAVIIAGLLAAAYAQKTIDEYAPYVNKIEV